MASRTSTFKFKSGTTVAGIDMADLATAMMFTAPLAFLLSTVMDGLPLLGVLGLFFKFVALKMAQLYRERFPPKIGPHFMTWLKYGDGLHITNDRKPIPLSVKVQTPH